MRSKTRCWQWAALAVCSVLTLGGCAGSKLERALADHRGTETWNKSSDAFKEIMRNYVHGHDEISDAELDEQFEDFVTLDADDVDAFILGQSCLPAPGSGPARYYMGNALHQRHDPSFAVNQERPIRGTGDGSQTMTATFSANMLLERHEVDSEGGQPERAQMQGNPFGEWTGISEAMSDRGKFDALFKLRSSEQADEVFRQTSSIDWSQASGELYIAPPLVKGKIFSPALFAVYLLRAEEGAPFSIYLTISANAGGDPETPYVGLINNTGSRSQEAFAAYTGFAFTYLSAKDNLLDYELVMTGEDPTSFELWITTAFGAHPDSPYLTVRTSVLPAVNEQAVASFTEVDGANLIMMIRKGALMRDLIETYYPDASELQLWEDVGALKGDPDFKLKLESAGLDVAAGLFEHKLWLKKPEVKASGGGAAPQFEVQPGMEETCAAN